MMGGRAPMAIATMWSLTAVTFIFVTLRLYTRAVVVHQVGWDDHIFVFSAVLLLLYTLFLNLSATYGFGQPITDLPLEDAVLAVKWEMVGQTFAVIGMATAKVSLGLFLLRIVFETWHKVVLVLASLSLLAVSILTAIVFWIQCIPPQSIFDPRVEGTCIIKVAPFSILLGSWCAAADFFFAAFPWLFIWQLNMRYGEKVTIAASMSLGVLAGACGVMHDRLVRSGECQLHRFDTVNLIVWSAAELAITMVCAGMPVIRPLFRRNKTTSRTPGASSSNDENKRSFTRGCVSHKSHVELYHLGSNANNRSDEEMLNT
ncbi:hypothetical protein QBC37DRAFT_440268 [Rhypophila decipiens]|uniref:Rhodopsin domain-containing protein n=1 Tax=Rhypophila decipiens TaxID=261697 RepID=A0AAN7BAT4_9PEZI|nr:hypothetical protein QBC37DRAFT_440268 [Rhypophila decipiens]